MNISIPNIAVAVLLLIAGFVLLIKGADFFVDGSSSTAKRLHVPTIIIGLTIVAMGTSLPETAVSVCASIAGKNSLAVSNAIGSNIFNLMVVIGMCAVMTTVPVEKNTVNKDIPISVLCAAALLALGLIGNTLGRIDGIILLVIFAMFIIYMIRSVKAAHKKGKENEPEETAENDGLLPVWKCIVFITGGAAAIAVGGDIVVDSATYIAGKIGISQTLVGLTIVSIGTSLPELVTSVVAARKKEIGMALGNAIGSNIFNIAMVLGIASAISPIGFIQENVIDILILTVFSVFVWFMVFRKRELRKADGFIMLALYAAYMVYICVR